jgi:histidinol phosphatase-like enzyme
MHAAVFLDRDGVLIENREDYVRTWEDVAIYYGYTDFRPL